MKNTFAPQYKPLMIYGLIFLGFIATGVIMGGYFLSEIATLTDSTEKVSTEIAALTERKEILQNVNSISTEAISRAQIALPTANNSLSLVSQIRTVATEQGLVIKNLDLIAQKAGEGTLAQSVLNFDVDGEALAIVKFVYGLKRVAPVISVDTVSLSSSSGGASANAIISVRSPWAAVPTKLPALTEPITALNAQETELSAELASYRYPFTTTVESSESADVGRVNPFE
jgi:hypothetical protein